MKTILKLEELGLLILFSLMYFYQFHGSLGLFLALFFVPDISFIFFLFSKKIATASYNFMHHQGIMVLLLLTGFFLKEELLIKIGLIFLAHSCFDRIAGYGLKYEDSFDHTHLGWIGKSKHLNK